MDVNGRQMESGMDQFMSGLGAEGGTRPFGSNPARVPSVFMSPPISTHLLDLPISFKG